MFSRVVDKPVGPKDTPGNINLTLIFCCHSVPDIKFENADVGHGTRRHIAVVVSDTALDRSGILVAILTSQVYAAHREKDMLGVIKNANGWEHIFAKKPKRFSARRADIDVLF